MQAQPRACTACRDACFPSALAIMARQRALLAIALAALALAAGALILLDEENEESEGYEEDTEGGLGKPSERVKSVARDLKALNLGQRTLGFDLITPACFDIGPEAFPVASSWRSHFIAAYR